MSSDELQAQVAELEGLLAGTGIAVLALDGRSRLRRFTPAVRDLFDLSPSDVGRPLADLRRKFTDPDLPADAERVLAELIPAEREVASEGGRTYLRRVRPHPADGVVVTFVDVTDQKAAEAATRASDDRLRALVRASSEVLYRMSGDWSRMLQLEGGDFLADTTRADESWLDRYILPADRPAVLAAIRQAIRTKSLFDLEHRVVRADGSTGWTRSRAVPVLGPNGDIVEWFGAATDVTPAKETEATLRANEERLRLILASAIDFGILTLDPDLTVTGWSPGAAAAFGYAADEIVGRPGELLFTPEDRAAGAPAAEVSEAQRVGRAADERWHLRKDGSRFYASGVLTPLGGDGRLGFVKVFRDLTDRKRMEDELRAARDRLEDKVAERTAELSAAVEALEAEMARRRATAARLSVAQEDERQRIARDLHDAVGQTNAALAVALKAAADAPPGQAADRLAAAQRLAEEMGRELHAAAVQLRPTALDDLGLEAALRELVRLWGGRHGVAADLHVRLAAGRLPREIETALYRVVQESLTNAAKHAAAAAVSVTVVGTDDGVRAVVEDHGAGFDPAAVGGGRLGLVGMRERLALVGGELEVESEPGRGTTVIARVPLGRPAAG